MRGTAANVAPFSVGRRSLAANVQRDALTTMQKQTQGIQIIKVITFFDGSQYQMPQDIAVAVHMKPECSPI